MTETNLLPPPPAPISRLPFKPLHLVIGLIISLAFVGTIFGAYYYGASQNAPVVLPSPTSAPQPTTLPTTSPTQAISPTSTPSTSSIIWLSKPQRITLENIFKEPQKDNTEGNYYHLDQVEYYQTATLPDGSKLINCFLPTDGMGTYKELYRFIKSADNKVSFIDENNRWQYVQKIFTAQISLSSFSIRELNPPQNISIPTGSNSANFKKGYLKEGMFDKVENPKLVRETEFGGLYVAYDPQPTSPDIRSREFYLKLKDSTYYSYTFQTPFVSDNMTVYLQWTDKSQISSQFQNKVKSGCGTGFFGPDVIKDGSSLLNSKDVVATYNSQNIYQIKASDSPLVKELYQTYKSGRDYPSAPPTISFENFLQAKNHFLYQDFLGDWLIFVNQEYAPMAECGKPVIYLYPEKDTQVSVKVAANITKSEPLYPQDGWQVLAHPNGQLEYENKIYPNLFWEGLGQGNYADHTGVGFVVPQSQLISTLKSQLKQLGLNSQESADFMEFWLPKLPTTPYVRLTWLDTKDMNELAPLQVFPLPRTVIRIFLEFEGLEKPVALKPQKLSSPPRVGFTLIEWGGLLRK